MPDLPIPRPGRMPRTLLGAAVKKRRVPRLVGQLPVSREISAGGIAVKVEDGIAYVACIGRRNRSGRLEWCLP